MEKLVTKMASNGLAIVTTNRLRWAADNLEDMILKNEDRGASAQDELPGGRSHIPIKVGGNTFNIIVGGCLEGAKATGGQFLLSSRKQMEGKVALF
jgi:hypothetical protein